MKRAISIFLFLIICSFSFYSQNDTIKNEELTFSKNTIYVSILPYPQFDEIFSLSAHYELIIGTNKKQNFNTIFRFGTGLLSIGWGGAPYINSSFGFFTGSKKSHFEMTLGAITFPLSDWFTLPAGTFGYRYQKLGGGFIFRTGIGFPEVLFISFGKSFPRNEYRVKPKQNPNKIVWF